MKQSTAEQLVRARLWEDPVAAVDRAIREQGAAKTTSRGSSLAKRLGPLRHAIAQRVHRGEQLTVLLITTTGAAMSRVRNRAFAIGMPSARLLEPPAMRRKTRVICPSCIGNRAAQFRAAL